MVEVKLAPGVTLRLVGDREQVPELLIVAFGPQGVDVQVFEYGRKVEKLVGVGFIAGNLDGSVKGCRHKENVLKLVRDRRFEEPSR